MWGKNLKKIGNGFFFKCLKSNAAFKGRKNNEELTEKGAKRENDSAEAMNWKCRGFKRSIIRFYTKVTYFKK